MLNIFKSPSVKLKIENPKMIHGKAFTWVELEIWGFCVVKLSSSSHPLWKNHKFKSLSQKTLSIVAPIGAIIDIRVISFSGIEKSTFKVSNADWIINAPKPAEIKTNLVKKIKNKIVQKWHLNLPEINQKIKFKQSKDFQNHKLTRLSIKAIRIINTNKK